MCGLGFRQVQGLMAHMTKMHECERLEEAGADLLNKLDRARCRNCRWTRSLRGRACTRCGAVLQPRKIRPEDKIKPPRKVDRDDGSTTTSTESEAGQTEMGHDGRTTHSDGRRGQLEGAESGR